MLYTHDSSLLHSIAKNSTPLLLRNFAELSNKSVLQVTKVFKSEQFFKLSFQNTNEVYLKVISLNITSLPIQKREVCKRI